MNAIEYKISVANSSSHLFAVSLRFPTVKDKRYTLSLPAWLPGSYMIRDFAKNIMQINTTNNSGAQLPITLLDKQTWQVTALDDYIEVSYQVFAFDLSVRTAYLDNQRGFFNGSSTFLAVKELAANPCQLTIEKPQACPHWRVATGLTRSQGTAKYQFGGYQADDYQELIDGPVAIGDFDVTEFEVEGVTHHMVFTSKHFGDTQRLCRDVAKLCQHHIELFSEAPFKEYWFITHLLANGFGGLEHKNSTILQASRFDLPNPNKPQEYSEDYITFLSLCSHEYFHSWNVCRIKPKAFIPYDLQQESYTTQLWAYEGITSYYDDFSLYRTGIIDFDGYLKLLSKTATRVYRGAGQFKQSVEESSFYAWTKFYKQGPDAVNNIVSYYTKGALIALWLDLTIRDCSKGQYSLDTLMRELWIHFGRPGIGTETADFINIVNILCQQDFSEEIQTMLTTATAVELTTKLAQFGVAFQPSKFKALNTVETEFSEQPKPYIGVLFKTASAGLTITVVVENSPAALAGLAVNDVLVAVDGIKATEASMQKLADHLPLNQAVDCVYFRDDLLLQSQLMFIDSPTTGVTFSVIEQEKVLGWQKIIN
ncbi:MAG: M61 family metallopeptidase [Thalassotalea sp.]